MLIIIAGCESSSKDEPAAIDVHAAAGFTDSDSVAVTVLVKDFFKAFEEKDFQTMSSIPGPFIKIIYHNGDTTNREEMLAIVQEAKNWWPGTRKLSALECIATKDMAVV